RQALVQHAQVPRCSFRWYVVPHELAQLTRESRALARRFLEVNAHIRGDQPKEPIGLGQAQVLFREACQESPGDCLPRRALDSEGFRVWVCRRWTLVAVVAEVRVEE